MWWRILIISLAFLLIGAHFMRYGYILACSLFTLAPLLLFIKHKLATRLLQATLLMSTLLVWGVSGYELVQMRLVLEQPWLRLSVIISAVAGFTLIAAACCNGIVAKRLRGRTLF
ncbi:conserved membrane protein of unknown function [Shewanella benthica]|uniref:Inner membrane protein n=1 Tax=Shewanella benthica TaxID=43661 RepID=A0A330M499_9GAMM|nr:hypothetical protein [Shewanella benthica]SQH76244.1 conserved membrane protein of unknown function [Shewanella benthica]